MGIFNKNSPQAQPVTQRSDISAVINRAPAKEAERLAWAQPELDYMSRSLSVEENVLNVASCSEIMGGVTFGIIALMKTRIIAVVGLRDRGGPRGRPIGQPNVHVFDFKDLYDLSFGSKNVRGVPGYYATFNVTGHGEVILDIGQDDVWANGFLGQAKQEMNRFKLA